jgi:hypothetical protein
MMEVCLYVLQCLYADEKKSNLATVKIIFSLRDQAKPKEKFQEEIAALIKKSL